MGCNTSRTLAHDNDGRPSGANRNDVTDVGHDGHDVVTVPTVTAPTGRGYHDDTYGNTVSIPFRPSRLLVLVHSGHLLTDRKRCEDTDNRDDACVCKNQNEPPWRRGGVSRHTRHCCVALYRHAALYMMLRATVTMDTAC